MKKILAIMMVVVAASAFTVVADEWKSVTLLEKVSVSMPGTVKDVPMPEGAPQKIKSAVLSDSSEVAAILVDFSKFGLSEEMLEGMKETDEFKDQLKAGITSTGGNVTAESSGQYKDKYLYYQYDIDVNANGKTVKTATRIVIYKSYAVTLSYKAAPGVTDVKNRDQFFNSLAISE